MPRFIADLHIHSPYSRATSKQLTAANLAQWAARKGIQLMATGDCLHPKWRNELKQQLIPTGNGLFTLNPDLVLPPSLGGGGQRPEGGVTRHPSPLSPEEMSGPTHFLLSTEISTIYKKNDKVRKVHHVCLFPSWEAVEKTYEVLIKIGNLHSDGRPILGLDSRDLLEIVLQSDPRSMLIPAHIWTPWFSVLGSKSGFDSIEDCYEDLTPYIYALETGLSSDPPMNRVCSFLDRFRLVSNSDAHSLENIGREANIFETELSYDGLFKALKDDIGFMGTVEFYPQEGKYHNDGHRACNVCFSPLQSLAANGLCPACGKPLTIGVMYRVAELADRPSPENFMGKQRYWSTTSLFDLLGEVLDKNPNSPVVHREYIRLTDILGPELDILLFHSLDKLKPAGELLVEGIRRMRAGEVVLESGYDGEYGRIRAFTADELRARRSGTLFQAETTTHELHRGANSIDFDILAFRELRGVKHLNLFDKDLGIASSQRLLNATQQDAIRHDTGPCMVIAGPGAGKTRVLVERMVRLVGEKHLPADHILALTFSNKAAGEIRERLTAAGLDELPLVSTFHAFGLSMLQSSLQLLGWTSLAIANSGEIHSLLTDRSGLSKKEISLLISAAEQYKQGITTTPPAHFERYQKVLSQHHLVDLSDLVYLPASLMETNPDWRSFWHQRLSWLFVDEAQDLNPMQYRFIHLLANTQHPNLFIIGDPDQAIYGFRGSDVRLMSRFQQDYPEMTVMQLESSYRCPQNLLTAARQVLKKTSSLQGTTIDQILHLRECQTEWSEADWLALRIEQLIGGTSHHSMDSGISDGQDPQGINSFRDVAILCRTSLQYSTICRALDARAIPYQLVNADPFHTERPYAQVIELLSRALHKLGNNPLDQEIQAMQDKQMEVDFILHRLCIEVGMSEQQELRLLRLAKPFGSDGHAFLHHLSLRRGMDDRDPRAERVSLMTIHAAKGLEFKAVFIPGCEQNLLPCQLFGELTEEQLAEEKRLLYVAITRAVQSCSISYARRRQLQGKTSRQSPSPFLKLIKKELFVLDKEKDSPQKTGKQLALF